ncbi:hypothetical protein C7212DRAFT_348314 [Tuber magnatum]|uniref:Uncharacterized protein n=1 Tax=Tuber magnatum TaxID=42249 RepID=A0A317SDD5_9PEZI|nr:hypothetical protein C7212DRAFT_348314 [Tuber magnatum]
MDPPTTNSITNGFSPGTDANTTWLALDISTLPDFLELPELYDFGIDTLPELCDFELCDFDIDTLPKSCDTNTNTLPESCDANTNTLPESCNIDPNSLPLLQDFLELLSEPMNVESLSASWDLGMGLDGTICNVRPNCISEVSVSGSHRLTNHKVNIVFLGARALVVLDSYIAQMIPWSFSIHNTVHKTHALPATALGSLNTTPR